MTIPEGLRYTREHEWIEILEQGRGRVGITHHAQDELGDVVFVELPGVGDELGGEDVFGTVESVKAVSDLYSPVTGKVIQVNESLEEQPELVNEDPYGEGWMIQVKLNDPAELDGLLSAEEYAAYVAEESAH
jgi:glycine cleavage system H protein